MKKLPIEQRRSTIAVPLALKREFQRLCFDQDLKQSTVITKMMTSWIEKEKKKQNLSLVANG